MSASTLRAGAIPLAAACLLAACGTDAPNPRPNVLVLSVDTLRRDFVGTYGAERGGTPHLDRLARHGLLAVDALATSSWTLPSHMSLLTGLYPAGHGVDGDGRALPAARTTLAEALSAEGYRTAGFVSGPYLHRGYGFDQGFDVYRHCMAYGIETHEDGRVSNVIGANLKSQTGETSRRLLEESTGWLASLEDDAPWFLFVHWWDPHYDFEPPSPWDAWLGDTDVRISGRGFLQNRRVNAEMGDAERQRLLDLYRGEIRWTDAAIGELLRELERRGERERTIVVVTADHGEEFFEHGNKGHRINLYGETLRVPLIVDRPGRDGGELDVEVRSLVDVVPTVTEALDSAVFPETEGVGLDEGRTRGGVVAELHRELVSVREARWKVVHDRSTDGWELYDVREDPGETRDLAEASPDTLAALRARWSDVWSAGAAPDADRADIDPATEEQLRALGYTD